MPMIVSDDDEDYEIEAIWNPIGYIRLHCHDSSGRPARVPKLTASEARTLAAALIAAADIADKS